MPKYRGVSRVPRKPGVYRAMRNIGAWKGFHEEIADASPIVRRVTIPKGAIIVVPEPRYRDKPDKFRVSALRIPGKRGPLYLSPYQGFIYAAGNTYECDVCTNIYIECSFPGFYVCWDKAQATYHARGY